MHKLAVLLLLCFPLFASADCTDDIQHWAKTLRPDLQLDAEHAVCKINPGDTSQILAALPFAENVAQDGQGDYGLGVVVASATTGKIIARHYQAGAISSDAIYFYGLELDTARYQLSPKLRAFGVRVNYGGSSRPNPFESKVLNLYAALQGDQLRPLMSGLEVSRSTGEWDTRCAGEFTDTQRTISISDQSNKGLAALRVEQTVIDTQNRPKGQECERIAAKPVVTGFTLEYDGNQYPVPKEADR
ncbi:hypothetical protein [Pseudomonas sp. nanlin1]|uniref:hypothetical protein n=1 Tax=Pseudomonas sp. nanlin1 TaxID=3040605 RepID=UPI00388E2EF9